MAQPRHYHKCQQKAWQRCLQRGRERLHCEQARAQRHLQALEQAVQEVALPGTIHLFGAEGPMLQVTVETGFKVVAGTPEQVLNDLAEAMLRLAWEPDLRVRMGDGRTKERGRGLGLAE
jgi:hypothetical protein